MGWCWLQWKKIPALPSPDPATPLPGFTVIIPARNEAATIARLLEALQTQQYPQELYDCIVVDDESEDDTARVVGRFPRVQLIQPGTATTLAHKKRAIAAGVAAAKREWIVCTDADCVPGPQWLATLADCIRTRQPVFIVAPVHIPAGSSGVQIFQSIDFMLMQGITGATVSANRLTLCNGANLAYRKEVFAEVNGFAGVDQIASGDDMLLLYKIWRQYPDRISYLGAEQAIVKTDPVPGWPAFFRQRLRWASKARAYEDRRIFPLLLLVYLVNLSFPLLLIAGFRNRHYWIALGIGLLLKLLVEWPLFSALRRFFRARGLAVWFVLLQPLHIVYIIISGLLGQSGSYTWKGRRVR